MNKIKYLILGAGVSGLTFASRLNNDEYCIIDKENEPGGYCRTTHRGEYVWDYAGHFFHFSHPQFKKKFEQITQSDSTVYRTKNTKVYYCGSYIDYPFQKNIHQLPKDEMIDCLYDLFERTEKENYENFQDMLYGKFGKSITEKFLRPYNEKLYACELNRLDVNAMGRFFPYADIKDIIRNMKSANNSSYNQEFLYPKKGASVFINKLIEGLDKDKIHLNETVQQIDAVNHRLETDVRSYEYEYLIVSIPLNNLVKITNDISIDATVFSYNQVLVFNLGFDGPSIDKEIHWIYVPEKDINFYRVGFYNNIIGTKNLSIYVEIGYDKEFIITPEEIDKQLNLTLKNLKSLKIINQHKLLEQQALIMNPAYVHITQQSLKEVDKIKNILNEKNIFTIGRYANWKYCSIEDCMIDALNLVERLSLA